jgi:hypothetical protein
MSSLCCRRPCDADRGGRGSGLSKSPNPGARVSAAAFTASRLVESVSLGEPLASVRRLIRTNGLASLSETGSGHMTFIITLTARDVAKN